MRIGEGSENVTQRSLAVGVDLLKKPPQRWHPRITPYRLLVLATTVSFGTTKAILAYKGETTALITLEWIAGVVVSLFLFFLGIYESRSTVPRYLSWIFAPDCMDVIWLIFRMISIPRPYYSSEELAAVLVPQENHPPVSGYRILVSTVVIVFGTGKAACGYVGLSTAANSIDWTFAVVVTSILYVLGLYENNTVGFLPAFFATDYTDALQNGTYQGFIILLYALGLITFGTWTHFFLHTLIHFLGTPLILEREVTSKFDKIYNLSCNAMMILVSLLGVALGIILLLMQLWAIGRAVPPIGAFTRAVRRRFLSFFATRIPLHSKAYTEKINFSQAIAFLSKAQRIFLYILLHILSAAACITLGVVFLGFFIKGCLKWSVHNEGFFERATDVIFLALSVVEVILVFYALFSVLRSLLQVKF